MRHKDYQQKMTKIGKILIASGNKGKIAEISEMLKEFGIRTVSAPDFNLEEPEETGATFTQNSLIKAKYYAEKTGITALADDSGLCIAALDGAPGIYSARWAKDEKTGDKNFALAFEKIASELRHKGVDLNSQKIPAYFICDLCLYNPVTKEAKNFEGKVDGNLVFPPRGIHGFGYDPIFIPKGHNKTFAQMPYEQKEKLSHRFAAFNLLKKSFY